MNLSRRNVTGLAAAALLPGVSLAQSNAPLRIGSTLALTGPLSATALVHKLAGEIYLEMLNARGGLLGRRVEWVLKDDQSKPDLARTLYEQLITVDKVDLIFSPYATGAILSAMGVAQRYNKVLVHHSFGIPSLSKYDMAFPAWSLGSDPGNTIPNMVFDAYASVGKTPKTIAIVTSKFPPLHFLSLGAREIAKKRGIKEVLFLEWEFGNRDFGPIAARVKDAKPDLVWMGDIALEGNMLLDSMKKIDYVPPNHFHTYPAPGPMTSSPDGRDAVSLTIFEEHAPFTDNAVASVFVKAYNERAAAARMPDTRVEVQAAVSFSGWQVLEAGILGARSFDDKAIAAFLKANRIDTIHGKLRFNGPGNYGDDLMKVKQVQNNRWVVVYPQSHAAGKLVAK